MAPQWNLCNVPGVDEPRVAKSQVDAVRKFLASTDQVLVCTHATFRFAVEELGVEAFDNDYVDVIIALGMAKEGFDWIWCEHALTIGYRSSLTEIVQIIGRATRDAVGKDRARFTNLIAEQAAVAEAVNDMLKAISASLLMEQVLAPRYEFTPKDIGPKEGFDYGPGGYQPGRTNVGVNEGTGASTT